MPQLTLFDRGPEPPPQAARLAPALRELAAGGVFFGTSSWKYEGWLGSIYAEENYRARGQFSARKFEADCLREYAQTFPVVCGDFSFYQFPTPDYWRRLFDSAPAPFLFAFKVPEEITVARWPTHERYGTRAGQANPSFLDAGLFRRAFARPLEPYRDRVATLIFEFGTLPKSEVPGVDDFVARLGRFLDGLPDGFRHAVEIRNPEFLGPEYLDVLRSHGVAHVFNAWTRMPGLLDQLDEPGVFTADFTVARALLRRGRAYADAVAAFQPYQHVQEPQPDVREGLARLARRARKCRGPAFLFVNNRLEGHAPSTIEAVVDEIGTL